MFAIYSESTQYKNAKWYFIYKEQEKNTNSVIFLNYNEGNSNNQEKDIAQHYLGYKVPQNYAPQIKLDSITNSISLELQKIREQSENRHINNEINSEINILLWNSNSLKDYTKRNFLI